jgi:hypothetical protein
MIRTGPQCWPDAQAGDKHMTQSTARLRSVARTAGQPLGLLRAPDSTGNPQAWTC